LSLSAAPRGRHDRVDVHSDDLSDLYPGKVFSLSQSIERAESPGNSGTNGGPDLTRFIAVKFWRGYDSPPASSEPLEK